MKIYNSKTRKKEEFVPIKANRLLMYVCGPTLYSEIHIGNARPLIFFDVVARYFKHLGYDVQYVSNITDIDDKIINRSIELGISEEQLVANNLQMYNKVRADMNLLMPLEMPMVTNYIDEIIDYIEGLIDLGFAYEANGNVYFSVDKISSYGEISNRKLEDLKNQGRIAIDTDKLYEHDFVLWKKTTSGVKWNAPFGSGRPGWHTECVVLINKILGSTIDIHGGGMDLKFPHHENENAQSHACGCNLANIWMHNGFVNIEDTKMSKSLGNVIYPQGIIEEYGANFLRLLMYKSSYRAPINISDDVKKQTAHDSRRIKRYIREYGINDSYHESMLISNIEEEMNNDFGIANALGLYFNYMSGDYGKEEKANVQTFILDVLGLVDENDDGHVPAEVLELIEERKLAKKEKNFELADKVREQISDLGYEIEDTREGVKCHKK